MKIAINTRLMLRGKLEGIGWFTYESVSRICRNHPEHEFHLIFDRAYPKEFIFSTNVRAHVVPPQARHPMLYKVWYNLAIPVVLKWIKADVFVSPDAMLSLRTNVPQLVVVHDLNFEHYPDDMPEIYSRYLLQNTPKFVRKAKRIATVSEYSKADIIKHYQVEPEKIDVVYNGVNESYGPVAIAERRRVKAQITGGTDYFVFVSSIHPRKNLHRLLKAFDHFKKVSGSDMKLVVVGKRVWLNNELDAAHRSMKFIDDVIFVGRLDPLALKNTVGSAIASVYISYFEGFGIPIIEAFRCGVPVITSNVTSMPEVAGDSALLVNPFSVEEISQALFSIWSDEDLREKLIAKGFERVKQFTWDKTAEALWQCIEKTMK